MDYKELRKKYPEFVYENFKIESVNMDLKIEFSFSCGNIKFTPFVIIKDTPNLDPEKLNVFAFNLGMVELLSYWKATYSPKIIIKSGYLDEWQKDWWKKLYTKGMGQYFYENKINFKTDSFDILIDSDKKFSTAGGKIENNILMAFSGGIDSTLSLDILNKNSESFGLFMMNPTMQTREMADNYKNQQIIAGRGIDPDLLRINNNGYLNGHTPISAYLAFLSVFSAYIYGYKYVVFSNERSSNEGNAKFLGEEINHQYSKTFEFENDFREYSKKYLSDGIEYFSFLRPLYNLQIAKLFAKNHNHFSLVKSCNVNQKSGTWCLTCPKCLSTFILLYPFITSTEVEEIFSGNVYTNEDLFPLLESLVDKNKVKPFECVGTREEILAGLFLSVQKHDGFDLPPLLKMAQDKILSKYSDMLDKSDILLKSWDESNNLPKNYERILREEIQK